MNILSFQKKRARTVCFSILLFVSASFMGSCEKETTGDTASSQNPDQTATTTTPSTGTATITDIKANGNVAFYLTSNGDVYCVSLSLTYGPQLIQSRVRGLKNIEKIGIGPLHLQLNNSEGIALDKNGKLYQWDVDLISLRPDSAVLFPDMAVFGSNKIVDVAEGGYQYPVYAALDDKGSVWTWGYNFDFAIGDSTVAINRQQPVALNSIGSKIRAISIGERQMVVLGEDGNVYHWGTISTQDREIYGKPRKVFSESGWNKVDAGGNYNLAARSDGLVYAWGHLKDGFVPGILSPKQLAAGSETSFSPMFITSDGTVVKTSFSQVTGLPQAVENVSELGNHKCKLMDLSTRGFFVTSDDKILVLVSGQTAPLILEKPIP